MGKMERLVGKMGRFILARNQRIFFHLYNRLSRRSEETLHEKREKEIGRVVSDLNRKGIAFWPGLYAESEFLEKARAEMNHALVTSKETFAKANPQCHRIVDDTRRRVYGRGKGEDGRTRVFFEQQHQDYHPNVIQKLMNDYRLRDVVSRYYQETSHIAYVFGERLEPSLEKDRWHFDRIFDQMKVMILLTDVTLEHGPVRYKEGTHRRPPDSFYHQVFREGVDSAYPPSEFIHQFPGKITYGIGKAGDAIFFDTLGFHSGTPCLEDERLVCNVTFYSPTLKNRVLTLFGGGLWM